MELQSRTTCYGIELSVDEIKTDIFNSSTQEIRDTIANLEGVLNDLYDMIDEEVTIASVKK